MSTLDEIEQAVASLSHGEQETLLRAFDDEAEDNEENSVDATSALAGTTAKGKQGGISKDHSAD